MRVCHGAYSVGRQADCKGLYTVGELACCSSATRKKMYVLFSPGAYLVCQDMH